MIPYVILVRRVAYSDGEGMGYAWAVTKWEGEKNTAGARIMRNGASARLFTNHAEALALAVRHTDEMRAMIRAMLS